MKYNTFNILIFLAIFILNIPYQDQQEKVSSNLNDLIYSGFLQSQSRVLVTQKIILSCKFKSMNRKSAKSSKLKNKFIKSKI